MKKYPFVSPIFLGSLSILLLLGCSGEQHPRTINVKGAIRPTSTSIPTRPANAPTHRAGIRLDPIDPVQVARSEVEGVRLSAVAYDCRSRRISSISFRVANGMLKMKGGDSVRYYPPGDLTITQDTITVAVWDDDGHHLEKEVPVTILEENHPEEGKASEKSQPLNLSPKAATHPLKASSKRRGRHAAVSRAKNVTPSQGTTQPTGRASSLAGDPPVTSSSPLTATVLEIKEPREGEQVGRVALVEGTASASLEGTTLQFFVLQDELYPQGSAPIQNGRFRKLLYFGRPGSIDVGKAYQVLVVAEDGSRSSIKVVRE